MLGVDGVVLDRGVEPEAVPLVAVVERALERLLLAPAAAAPAAASAPAALGLVVVFLAVLVGVGLLVLLLALVGSASSAAATSASSSARRSAPPRPRRRVVALAGLSPGTSSCSRLKLRMSPTDTSSWWAIHASVRPWRTQVRIWLSWGFSDLRAKRRRRLPIPVAARPLRLVKSLNSAVRAGEARDMLVLTRKGNQSIMIGDDIEVSVLAIMGRRCASG